MEQRAVSVFDTCLEQALHEAEPLMAAMCNAALASLGAQLSSYSNAEDQQLLLHAQSQLTSKKAHLPLAYALRLRQAVFAIAEGKREDYHAQMSGQIQADGLLEDRNALRAQIEWGRMQINLLQQTEQSLTGLERVYRPLRKITRYWRNGNPLHHTVYLDSLQATLSDVEISADATALFLPDMVGVMADHLQTSYQRIMTLAMNSYAELLAKAELKRRVAKDNTRSFVQRTKTLFDIPAHCPVGAVRAYKTLIPVMERMAAQDSSFWIDADHPARMLVQTIVDKATVLKEEGRALSDPQFPQLVTETVETLSALAQPTAADFAQALSRFGVRIKPRLSSALQDVDDSGYSSSMLLESQWGASGLISISPESDWGQLAQLQAERELLPPAPQAVPLQATASAAAPVAAPEKGAPNALEQIESDVMLRLATSLHSFDVDPALLAALTGAWPKVLLQAAERSGQDSSHYRAYQEAVDDVLALAGANASASMHSDADMLIPSLLTRLKSGLTSIGWMPERIAPVLTAVAQMAPSALVELQMVQEEGRHAVPAVAGPLSASAAPISLSPAPSPSAWAQLPDAVDAIGEDEPAIIVTGSMLDAPRPDSVGLWIGGKRLEAGVWLEFLGQGGGWVPKQLSWTNARATMFLFVASGGASQSITRRMLEKLAQEQAVRPV
ncbi:DUF1631 family protein [Comamonas sp. JUb58]|uniref:DUF1631 family protein n=1 Tax=Comamonas sp. JUb58 TaxID=2485114 RepID=UPI00105D4AE5|nr:DUF1631 family protein [Comamonas sp. JUb58]TDS78178.1 uncharacterized protein DUF1631 [Comamonas sp. JUb58]